MKRSDDAHDVKNSTRKNPYIKQNIGCSLQSNDHAMDKDAESERYFRRRAFSWRCFSVLSLFSHSLVKVPILKHYYTVVENSGKIGQSSSRRNCRPCRILIRSRNRSRKTRKTTGRECQPQPKNPKTDKTRSGAVPKPDRSPLVGMPKPPRGKKLNGSVFLAFKRAFADLIDRRRFQNSNRGPLKSKETRPCCGRSGGRATLTWSPCRRKVDPAAVSAIPGSAAM